MSEVDAKGAIITLAESVEGHLRSSEMSRDRVEDARTVMTVGDEIEARFMGVDRKNRTIMLSIKAKDAYEEAAAVKDYGQSASSTGSTSLGDLLKEKLEGNS